MYRCISHACVHTYTAILSDDSLYTHSYRDHLQSCFPSYRQDKAGMDELSTSGLNIFIHFIPLDETHDSKGRDFCHPSLSQRLTPLQHSRCHFRLVGLCSARQTLICTVPLHIVGRYKVNKPAVYNLHLRMCTTTSLVAAILLLNLQTDLATYSYNNKVKSSISTLSSNDVKENSVHFYNCSYCIV